MAETYVYIDDNKPLDCPITCLGGQKDPQTTNETLAAWSKQTRSNFKLRMFPGDHFFIQSERNSVLQALSEELKAYTHASV
jgi:medium-chain acyl-[acyl-carrier-protein] hydrolase